MGNYVNGYSYPVINIVDYSTYAPITQIELDLCGSAGLVESYEEDFKRNQLENGRIIDYDFKGSNIIFTLDYSDYIRKANAFKIEQLAAYNSQPETYRLLLRPRADVQARSFEVRMENNFDMGILRGGSHAGGNRLPVIKFVTVQPGSKMFLDPDNLSIKSLYKVKF